MNRLTMTVMVGVLLGTQLAAAFEPGEKVVVAKPTVMMTSTGSTLSLTFGTTLTNQGTAGDQLKVAVGRVGTIDPTTVIPASEADAHFSDLIAKNHSKSITVKWIDFYRD